MEGEIVISEYIVTPEGQLSSDELQEIAGQRPGL